MLEGKDQIHLILFLINQETSRTLLSNDLLFIKRINPLNIKVLYVITRSMTHQRGNRFKDLLALTLKNEFGRPIEEYRNKIYPVHLVNEPEDLGMNHIESFGIHDLFLGIFNEFRNDRVNITQLRNIIEVNNPNYWRELNNVVHHSLFFHFIQELKDILAFHQQKALIVIGSYTVLAGAIGASPIPIADFFLLTPIQVSMAAALAAIYGIFRTRDELLTLIKSLRFNAIATGIGKGIGSGLKLIPGLGTVAGVILDSTVSSVTTLLLGYKLRDYFENEIRAMGTLPLVIRMAEDFNRSVDSFDDLAHYFN